MFDVPRIIFTLRGNKKSEEVIRELGGSNKQEYRVFGTSEEIRAYFQSGVLPTVAVVLFDYPGGKAFTMATHSRADDVKCVPAWAHGAQWAVKIHSWCKPSGCARQLRADFLKKFESQLVQGRFPWGFPRKKESPPAHVVLPDISEIISRLNSGPDFAAAIADTEYALELPEGSRISWLRVAPEPIGCNEVYLQKVLIALEEFERAGDRLVRSGDSETHEMLCAGVAIEPHLKEAYLYPSTNSFSVRRPDLHYTGSGLFASENDEMPGGFAEIVHLDNAYLLNQERWEQCFRWLTKKGLLLFIVSHEWSKCYIPEITWLVGYLRSQGYSAEILTTDCLNELSVTKGLVHYRGKRVETIWRQFPIFETRGVLADLVDAARNGVIRMVPEFAHFGNKTWFSIFRKKGEFFRKILAPETYSILNEILPDSHLVVSPESFPCRVAGITINDLGKLYGLDEEQRNSLVLKVTGANTMSSRSYGVLMGHGLAQSTWHNWIADRICTNEPFIIQRRLNTAVAQVPVKNLGTDRAELFGCRILLRPWVVGGALVSANACAVPSNTLRVHGRVDMAVLPVVFDRDSLSE